MHSHKGKCRGSISLHTGLAFGVALLAAALTSCGGSLPDGSAPAASQGGPSGADASSVVARLAAEGRLPKDYYSAPYVRGNGLDLARVTQLFEAIVATRPATSAAGQPHRMMDDDGQCGPNAAASGAGAACQYTYQAWCNLLWANWDALIAYNWMTQADGAQLLALLVGSGCEW